MLSNQAIGRDEFSAVKRCLRHDQAVERIAGPRANGAGVNAPSRHG